MSFFYQLIEATDTNRLDLEALTSVQDMLNGRYSKEKYVDFLHKIYHIVLHFCPIMAAAASRCGNDMDEVRNYFYDQISEERGHEKMVLDDLATFDVEPASVIAATAAFPVQAMLGYNYYTLDRVHPCGVLGMVYVLEIISSVYGGHVAASISQSLDRPLTSGFSFLDSHSSMDMEHMAKLRKLLQSIDSPDAQNILVESVKMNFYLVMQIFKD
jgi:ferritin